MVVVNKYLQRSLEMQLICNAFHNHELFDELVEQASGAACSRLKPHSQLLEMVCLEASRSSTGLMQWSQLGLLFSIDGARGRVTRAPLALRNDC